MRLSEGRSYLHVAKRRQFGGVRSIRTVPTRLLICLTHMLPYHARYVLTRHVLRLSLAGPPVKIYIS